MAVWKMSEALYVVTCQKIGTPELVASRRDIVDIKELLENKKNIWARTMFSGSHREGFRLLAYGSIGLLNYQQYDIIFKLFPQK